ncbi:glucosaminidase domain-containing protein [Candidatus Pelagibacter bacterium]|nr:glucosaminidase domain-containing protein [Candidatus Pelagibacter bacterium]MDA9624795.1 glucosaminidase domain-containing protein [Candidatus Pelagibacter bacterium]
MKKKLTYRDKLLELASIYKVKEIQEYIRRRKNLTSGQIELILRKNKIIIPKDFQTSFFKENFTKPISRISKQIDDIKDDSFKSVNKFSRKISDLKEDSKNFSVNFFSNLWNSAGKAGLGFLNIFPKLWETIYNFVGNLLTDLFHGIYNQKINTNKANSAIIGFFVIIGIVIIVISGITTFNNPNKINQVEIVKKQKEIKKPEITDNKPKKKPELKIKKEVKKPDPKFKKEVKKPNIKKKEKASETILPDLNLKTETVLNLFKDVDYDLNTVRYEKKVKPIYFTQFPKDLDEIQSVQLKKETFIKIVLPLVVAENEKILADRVKLKKITSRKMTTDEEKQWLRQKFLEYKVKKGNVEELKTKMDIIPASIALAQAAKESGWGTSRFALEGNAIFGQWTWNGKGIAPLNRDKSKNHKILKFPILRASVKAYKNNLNTHKSYVRFREMRKNLREKNKKITGLLLTKTLENYAETGNEYTKILEQIITQNRLMDFELVRLTNSAKKREVDL